MARRTVTYFLWFCGGIFGLHHLYLNRPIQCFIWFVTWGGMGIGWLSDIAHLNAYVEEANETKEYKQQRQIIQAHRRKPEFSLTILAMQFMTGHQIGSLLIHAVPDHYTIETWYGPCLSHLLAALGASIGVHLASNIGSLEAPFLKPFLASVATLPTALFLYNRRTIYIMLCVAFASFVSSRYCRVVTKSTPSSLIGYLKMWSALGLGLLLYGMLWGSSLYHNTKVYALNGTRIPLHLALSNFMKIQPWEETNDVLADVIPCLRMYKPDICMNRFLGALTEISDPDRDAWAFYVLGFEKYPSKKQMNSHCRKLSSVWHPDRFTKANETKKNEAEKRFLDIQKACSLMNSVKINRERKSTWSASAMEPMETVIPYNDDVETEVVAEDIYLDNNNDVESNNQSIGVKNDNSHDYT